MTSATSAPLHDGSTQPSAELRAPRMIIESLGVYLPPTVLTTREILQGCAQKLDIPLETFTGIESRRVAGDGEFSLELAEHAAHDCLRRSRWSAGEIELLMCCNISRRDGQNFIGYEPSSAARLGHRLGLDGALKFDLSNACAGMFTGLFVARTFLRLGLVRNALILSGENCSHLIEIAQQQIAHALDPLLASLTVGDAGAALLVESTDAEDVGFHDFELYTLGKYSQYCIAKGSGQGPGAVMHTDSVALAGVTVKEAVAHSAYLQQRSGWSIEGSHYLIPHQTSNTTINAAVRETNRYFGRRVCSLKDVINNLKERGNTATTSHTVALFDSVRAGRIRSGDRLTFGIGASGVTLGTALYALDDLPERLLDEPRKPAPPVAKKPTHPRAPRTHGLRVAAIGLADKHDLNVDSVSLAAEAANRALGDWRHDRGEVGLLLHAGVYRTEFLSEPAVAALLAGRLEINDAVAADSPRKTLAFDILNGGLGFLNACEIAARFVEDGRCAAALVAAAEIENNAAHGAYPLLGLRECASALVLERTHPAQGFQAFAWKTFSEHLAARTVNAYHDGKVHYVEQHGAGWPECLLTTIPIAVQEFLAREGVRGDQIDWLLAPQISSAFLGALADSLGMSNQRVVDACDPAGDLFTSSLPYALRRVLERGWAKSGDLALLVCAGSGVQVGCALYRF